MKAWIEKNGILGPLVSIYLLYRLAAAFNGSEAAAAAGRWDEATYLIGSGILSFLILMCINYRSLP